MTSEDWNDGRTIKEIRERMFPTAEQNKEIDADVKKKFKSAHTNLSKVAPKDEKIHFISLAQLKSNSLLKVQITVFSVLNISSRRVQSEC